MAYKDIASISPYFDDYASEKLFYSILYNPSRAVQARELTQMQSILQNQVKSVANHLFKDNSIIVNAGVNHSFKKRFFKITDNNLTYPASATMITSFLNKTITDGVTTARVTHVDQTNFLVYFNYISGPGYDSTSAFNVSATDSGDLAQVVQNSVSVGTSVSCDSGIIYTGGYFVEVLAQEAIVDSNIDGYYHMGFVRTESVVTANTDSTLGDPASGTNNAAQPGGDRYKIDLTLSSYIHGDAVPTDFIEFLIVKAGVIIKEVSEVEYGPIIDLLASRTYDESGNYIVDNFAKVLEDHPTDTTKLIANLQPGKAYVLGNKIHTSHSTAVAIDRARDFKSANNNGVYVDYGQYLTIAYDDASSEFQMGIASAGLGGIPNFSTGVVINIYSGLGGTGTLLGTLKGTSMQRIGTELRLYVTDIAAVVSKIPVAKSLTYVFGDSSTWYANLHRPKGYAEILGEANSPILEFTEYDVVKAVSDLNYDYTRVYQNLISNGTQIVISGGASDSFYGQTSVIGMYLRGQSPGQTAIDVSALTVVPSGSNVTISTIPDDVNGYSYDIVLAIRKTALLTRTKTTVPGTFDTIAVDSTANTINTIFNLTKEDGTKLVAIYQKDNFINSNPGDAAYAGLEATYQGNAVVDVTAIFLQNGSFNGGQKTHYYDVANLTGMVTNELSAMLAVPGSTQYYVVYDYFSHSSGVSAKAFTGESYPIFEDIPSFTTTNGTKTYNLTNSIDFRFKVSELSQIPEYPYQYTQLSADVDYYLSRIDKIYVSKDKVFGVRKGISSVTPEAPNDLDNTITLHVIKLPAYTYNINNIVSTQVEQRRYTMADIGVLDSRINSLERYVSLSLLEKNVTDLVIKDVNGLDRFKSGIFVDSFRNTDTHNIEDPSYDIAIDSTSGIARPPFSIDNIALTTTGAAASSSVTLGASTAIMDYTINATPLAENLAVTGAVNVNEFLFFQIWNGNLVLKPAVDNWVDTTQQPSIQRSETSTIINETFRTVQQTTIAAQILPRFGWNWWGTNWIGRNAESVSGRLGTGNVRLFGSMLEPRESIAVVRSATTAQTSWPDVVTSEDTVTRVAGKVISTAMLPFMRQRTVTYNADSLRPGSIVEGFFDNKPVVLSNGTVDANGLLTGTFTIPSGIPAGEKVFELKDAAETSTAAALYTSTGRLNTRSGDTITTVTARVINRTTADIQPVIRQAPVIRTQWADPLAQSFLVNSKGGAFISSIDLYVRTKSATAPLTVYLVAMSNGMPTSDILPFSRVTKSAASVTASVVPNSALNTFTFSDLVYLEDGTEYAFVVQSESNDYEIFVSTLGEVDIVTGLGILRQPYLGSMFKSQNSTTWTPDQTSDIRFSIKQAVFSTVTASIFNVINETAGALTTANVNFGDLILPETSIEYDITVAGEPANTSIANGTNIAFANSKILDVASARLSARATMTTTNANISPVIDRERMSVIAVLNVLDANLTTPEFAGFYGAGTYVSQGVQLVNAADSLKVLIDAITPAGSGIKVSFKTEEYKPVYLTLDTGAAFGPITNNSLVNKQVGVYHFVNGTSTIAKLGELIVTGYSSAKIYYRSATDLDMFTKVITGGDVLFLSDDLLLDGEIAATVLGTPIVGDYRFLSGKLWLNLTGLATAPSISNPDWSEVVSVAYDRTLGSQEEVDSVVWRPMTLAATPNTASNDNVFTEFEYNPTIEPESDFKSFSVKVEFFIDPANAGNAPQIKNLRAIALR